MALLQLCLFALFQVGQSKGGGTTNIHVSFGDRDPCVAPPLGTCADFAITEAQVVDSLAGFTTYNGSSLTTSSINYYGIWWNTVGTHTPVAADFCTHGDGANQTSTSQNYSGVTFVASNGQWIMGTASTPAADCENYCSAAGGVTPAHMTTTFGSSYTQNFSLTPSSKRRSDISNSVGYAVDGVVIFSPFTFIKTVAAYDETLDTCLGHPAQGLYHYHGFSPCIHGENATQIGDSIPHSKIYGWAFDGFPIYGPYGYTDGNDTTSKIARVTGGYACTSDGVECTTDAQKAVATNWAYNSSNPMLDDCNGRWTKTPEFSNGMYVYVLNVQANGSPDFPGVPYCHQTSSIVSQTFAPTTALPTTAAAHTASTTVAPTTTTSSSSMNPSCSAVVGKKWTNEKCHRTCGDNNNCPLSPSVKSKCIQRCTEDCACNSRRLVASVLV
jgi:hypothetical protein